MLTLEKHVDLDVLVVGGGIGGMMAAINAADNGAKVAVAEKANTKRSGNGGMGNDHILCYIPELHKNINSYCNEVMAGQLGKSVDKNLMLKCLEESFDIVKKWDQWGIPMMVNGKWEFTGHAFPGRIRTRLKYAGANQKEVLTREAKKSGVGILNKLSITDIITKNGKVIGAMGISLENDGPVIKLFRVKSVILATGHVGRLYPPITPGWMFNTGLCPVCVGSGRAIAYRAGAQLVNMEFPSYSAGTRYFARSGKGTWIGVLKDMNGNAIGPFIEKPDRELGDITVDIWKSVFKDMHKSGKGPAYMDCSEASDEDIEYMKWGLSNEGNLATLDGMAKEGIDLKKHMVEFGQYDAIIRGRGGIDVNVNAETSLKGLYAAGDEAGNFRGGIAGAAIFGSIAGENSAKYSKSEEIENIEQEDLIKERRELYSEIMSRKNGPSWKEANLALQQIMMDYAGTDVRSKTLLTAGQKYLGDLRKKVYSTVKADDAHTLVRCCEVFDLIDVGETVFIAALERKETRDTHKRSDYTFTNPLLNDKFMMIRQIDGKPEIKWRDQVK